MPTIDKLLGKNISNYTYNTSRIKTSSKQNIQETSSQPWYHKHNDPSEYSEKKYRRHSETVGKLYKNVFKEEHEAKVIDIVELDNDKEESSNVVVYKVENNEMKQLTREEKIEFLRQEYYRLTGEELIDESKTKEKVLF